MSQGGRHSSYASSVRISIQSLSWSATGSAHGVSRVKARRSAVFLSAALALVPCGARPQTSDPPLSLEEAIALGASANKTMAAARLRQRIDRAGIDVARERPNPELRVEATRETPRQSLTALQLVETGGKRRRRIELAEAIALTGEAETALVIAQTRVEIRRAYYAVATAQRKIAIARESRTLAERARAAARDRFDVGDVARLDVLQAELAALQASNEAGSLSGGLRAVRSELNALVGRDPDAPTSVNEDIESEPAPDATAALSQGLSANAAVRQLDQAIAEAEAKAALARAQQTPDAILEAAVTHDSPPEFVYGWRAAVGIAIPVFTRHRAAVRVEEATLAKLQLERQALAERIGGAVVAALARATAQREAYVRFHDEILPRTREVAAMAEDSYRSGRTGLVTLLQSLQATREIRTKAADAAFEFQSALADLEQAAAVGPK